MGQLEREGVGARLDLARELVPRHPEDERSDEQPKRIGGEGRRAARIDTGAPDERTAKLTREQQPQRRDEDQEGEAAWHVVVLDVAELVGDDASQLRAVRPA